jgi:hypothetical protein
MRQHVRWMCVVLLCVALFLSLYTLHRLSGDFSFLPPSKVW